MNENPLYRLLNPASIATVGAGNNFAKMGTMHAMSIIKDGYSGRFYPIHPRDDTVLGHAAFRTVQELPETPELAILIVPSNQVPGLLEDFGARGTKSAIIISGGFGEAGAEGERMQNKLNEISARYGIRFLGPNCMGIINTEISLNTTVIPYDLGPGSLGFASQSGTYVTQTIIYLGKRGIRFSKAISVGNSADIDIIDALEYLGSDAQTRAISLYIEGIRDIPRFVETARRITPLKPVLAQYVGGSAAGARASLSHTGTMAAPDHLYDGLFRQAGIIRVHTVADLYAFGHMLAVQPRLEGNRIGVVTNSGGPGSSIAHALDKGGLAVPEFSKALQQRLRELLPPHAPCKNPVDLTFHTDLEVLGVKIPGMVLASGEVDGIILHGVMSSGFTKALRPHLKGFIDGSMFDNFTDMMAGTSRKIVSFADSCTKPVAVSSFFDRDDDCTAMYEDHNVPVFDSPEKAANGMVCMLQHLRIQERKPWRPVTLPEPLKEAVELIGRSLSSGLMNLDEHDSKRFLGYYGIPVIEDTLVDSEGEIAGASRKIGFPLVVKASAPDILHKTGKGLIYLNQNSPEEASRSYRKIQEAAGRRVPVIMSRMVRGEREFAAGAVITAGFGPAVMFGLGGIFTEALGDAVFRPAPITADDGLEMIREIRARKLLGSFRGMPEVNIESLAGILHRLSIIPLLHPEVAAIDVNPVIIEGSEPKAVDALVIFNK